MKKILLIYGATGSLGKGVSDVLIQKDYTDIFLFGRDFKSHTSYPSKVKKITVGNLSEENNVIASLNEVPLIMDCSYYLYSTIGGFASGLIKEMDYTQWKKLIDINLNIAFLLSKHFSILISKSAGGSICFTSAGTAFTHETGKSAYGASKLALNYLVETLALEGKEYKMTANVVAPNIIDTPENREWVENKNQLTHPETIAETAHKLFSEPNKFNGKVINLSGNDWS